MLHPLRLILAICLWSHALALRLADEQHALNNANSTRGRTAPLQLLRGRSKLKKSKVSEAEAAANEAVRDAATEDASLQQSDESVDQDDAPFEVEADASVTTLQMVLYNLPPGPFVRVDKVDQGGWAEQNGIESGSTIETVNGKVAKDMNMEEFKKVMKKRPLKLTIKPPPVAAGAPVAVAAGVVTPFGAAAPAGVPAAIAPSVTLKPLDPPKPQARGESKKEEKKSEKIYPQKGMSRDAYEAVVEAGRKIAHETTKKLLDEFAKRMGLGKNVSKVLEAAAAAAQQASVAAGAATAAAAAAPAAAGAAAAQASAAATQQVAAAAAALIPPAAPAPAGPPVLPVQAVVPRVSNAGPPEPIPPSPLDALKAAMAIRANLTDGHAALLPPDVLDKVANMARGRLGAFTPGTPGFPCAPSPAAAYSPAPMPAGTFVEKVKVSMTVKNVSFTALQSSPKMVAEFEQSVKATMAEAAGVDPADIDVALKAGSVVVDGEITPPPGVKAGDLDKNLEAGSDNIGARLVARVAVLPGVDTIALGDISATGIKVMVVQQKIPVTTVTTTPPPTRHLPKPPACAAAPPKMGKADIRMALAPFKPPGARGAGVKTEDGGKAWPLEDGGWAFQYPDMALRMAEDGTTRIVWKDPAYSVEYDESGISYHVGQNVVHRGTNGDLTYQQPTGTMHQEGDTLVYHWCNPNVIVYQTPAGFVYYDDMGMTYRSFGKDVTHYTWSGEVLYQGEGGVTRQAVDGTVTHWTDAGAVYRHPDGSVFYTPVGESGSNALSMSDLGPDPFGGKELSTEDILLLSAPNGTQEVIPALDGGKPKVAGQAQALPPALTKTGGPTKFAWKAISPKVAA